MSSEIATSLAGHGSRRARSRAPASSSASSLRRELRPPAAFVGHAGELARFAHQLAGGAIDLGDHRERIVERPRADRHHHEVLDVDAPARVRAAAEDLDLGQRQRRPARRRRGTATAACRAPRPRHARPRATPRPSRCRRASPCSACRRARPAAASMPAWSSASMPKSARAIGPRTFAMACATSHAAEAACRRRAGRSPRASRASAGGRDARGRWRRRRARTSASTVGPAARIPDAPARARGNRMRSSGVIGAPACERCRAAIASGSRAAIARERADGSLPRRRRSGTRPATCRRCARA